MSTDRTPIDRAKEVLVVDWQLTEEGAYNEARAALSAALTNDADPDWLARVIGGHTVLSTPEWGQSVGCRCGWTPDWTGHASEETWVPWIRQFDRHVADAVRAKILGEA